MHQKNFPSSSFHHTRFNIQLQYGEETEQRKILSLVLYKTNTVTGSVDAVHWLNRFGHSISYDEINALETKLAEEQVNNQTIKSLVPTHTQLRNFVNFCFNNCDHNMESIYNATLHGTNGII